ncbi:MAG: molybdenum transport ATP-binding protein [Isosphaera sp.]|nr:molybdenum transport ATP-binding protein [Isosphaera sp.]
MTDAVVELDEVAVVRGEHGVFAGLTWTVRDGQAWAVVGPTGSGKTTLAELVLGKLRPTAGAVRWPLLARVGADYPSQAVAHVAFREESRLFSYAGHYYQQRFEFADADSPLSLEQFLRAGTAGDVAAVADRLGVREQLSQPFMTLSNGQTRRARLARALLAGPELLVLDDPFVGLDAAGRADLAALLGELVREGKRLVLICRADAVPGWVTDVLDLAGRTATVRERVSGGEDTRSLTVAVRPDPVAELRGVTVRHAGRAILDDVSWTVRAGERWAVVGPNGSGKTTLLSLLCGDHPQAYANDIRLFGRRRGTGETVWDVKRNVGLVSPEFHLYFTESLTADRATATGFADGVTDRPTSPEQDARVRELFGAFGISHLHGRPFRHLSTGEQRLVLLARALVKRPPLVILDEPFQSLDAGRVEACRAYLDRELGADQTLLFVTHDPAELPRSVTRTLRLDRGEVAEVV